MTEPDRTTGRDVAEDMAALFGPGVRPAPATPPRPLPVRSGHRRRTLALGVAGVAVAVTAGVLAGTSAVGPAATPPAVTAPARAAAPRERPTVAPSVTPVTLPPADAAPARDVADAAGPAAAPIEHAAPAVARDGVAVARAPEVPRFAAPRAAGPARFAAAPRVPSVPPARAVSARGERCLDDPYCAGARLYDADGEVAAAYADASDAGVSARLLRDYRGEWLRARRVGRERPREALRVYGMIAADLRLLATDSGGEDPRVDERSTWR
ncbi:hypothetical protein [Sphingomonas sp. BK580]|uniref:hypothetical protein n=1 Tax=Sphingomonas sp. BK580 TaxID=2586972 RepID=UPI00160D1D14|nr:hypothetical protein [Sphingomonas sp. BK580]MBB3694271.1 hypothetical protein [Sphingomonas sp. BK580]